MKGALQGPPTHLSRALPQFSSTPLPVAAAATIPEGAAPSEASLLVESFSPGVPRG